MKLISSIYSSFTSIKKFLLLLALTFYNCGFDSNVPYKIDFHDNNKIICAFNNKVFDLDLLYCDDPRYDYRKGNLKYNVKNGIFIRAKEGDIIKFSFSLTGGFYDRLIELLPDMDACWEQILPHRDRYRREIITEEELENGTFAIRILKLQPFTISLRTLMGRTIQLGVSVNYESEASRCILKVYEDDGSVSWNFIKEIVTVKKNQEFRIDLLDLRKGDLWENYITFVNVRFYDENRNLIKEEPLDFKLEKCKFPDFVGLAILNVETAGGRKDEFWMKFEN